MNTPDSHRCFCFGDHSTELLSIDNPGKWNNIVHEYELIGADMDSLTDIAAFVQVVPPEYSAGLILLPFSGGAR